VVYSTAPNEFYLLMYHPLWGCRSVRLVKTDAGGNPLCYIMNTTTECNQKSSIMLWYFYLSPNLFPSRMLGHYPTHPDELTSGL
jgi:hypothetical protein